MYKILLACLLLAWQPLLHAQQTIKPLMINEPFPKFATSNVMGFGRPIITSEDLKGRLVIFDFWMTTCRSCILAFPKMEALQKRFGDSVRIVLVAPNSKEEILRLFTRLKKPMPQLPMIYSDTVLQQYFPYVTVPQHAWINQEGRMHSVTEGTNATVENIAALLKGEKREFVARQEVRGFDWEQPLISEGGGRGLSTLQYYSLFLGQLDLLRGTRVTLDIDTADLRVGIKLLNVPLSVFYKIAYGEHPAGGRFELDCFVAYETKDNDRFIQTTNESLMSLWRARNLFCYESSLPVHQRLNIYEQLRDDLRHYLAYEAKVEKRMKRCLILKKNGSVEKLIANANDKPYSGTDNNLRITRNRPVSALVNAIQYAFRNAYPVLDETYEGRNITISLNTPLNDFASLKNQLKVYGLTIEEEDREVETLVIGDKN